MNIDRVITHSIDIDCLWLPLARIGLSALIMYSGLSWHSAFSRMYFLNSRIYIWTYNTCVHRALRVCMKGHVCNERLFVHMHVPANIKTYNSLIKSDELTILRSKVTNLQFSDQKQRTYNSSIESGVVPFFHLTLIFRNANIRSGARSFSQSKIKILVSKSLDLFTGNTYDTIHCKT